MIERSSIPPRLAMKFSADYTQVMKHYNAEEQIELSKYLCSVFKFYLAGEESTKENLKWIEDETEKLKIKFGKNYEPFMFGGLFKFLFFEIVLAEKGIYTKEEYGALKQQSLTDFERMSFLKQALVIMQSYIDMLYLQGEPKGKAEINGTSESRTEQNRKGKIKREREDNITKLNQEQTALLIHFLQAGKIILRDEYLNNKEAGQAFSILTGYSADSIRQNLSDAELKRIANKKNLDNLANSLTSLQLLIDKERKEKK